MHQLDKIKDFYSVICSKFKLQTKCRKGEIVTVNMRTGLQFNMLIKFQFGKNNDCGTVIQNLHVCVQ